MEPVWLEPEPPPPAPNPPAAEILSEGDLLLAYNRIDADRLAGIEEHVRLRLGDLPLLVELAAATQKGNGVPRHENGFVASHMELVPKTVKELALWSVVTGTPHAASRQLNYASPEAGSGIYLLATNATTLRTGGYRGRKWRVCV
jgi:hypothetical protein